MIPEYRIGSKPLTNKNAGSKILLKVAMRCGYYDCISLLPSDFLQVKCNYLSCVSIKTSTKFIT